MVEVSTPPKCARPRCGRVFQPARRWQKYCSNACRHADHSELRQKAKEQRERKAKPKAAAPRKPRVNWRDRATAATALLASIREEIDAFDKKCSAIEYTDTGDVWEMLERWRIEIREVTAPFQKDRP